MKICLGFSSLALQWCNKAKVANYLHCVNCLNNSNCVSNASLVKE